jgi:hypothetical protein
MVGKRLEPNAERRSMDAPEPDQTPSPAERTGPLRVERLRKEDGRALILYSAAAERE